jgi:hypothetical protein
MRDIFYRVIGNVLTLIGIVLVLIPVLGLFFAFTLPGDPFFPPLEIIPILIGLLVVGFGFAYGGNSIHRKGSVVQQLLTKAGEPIHSAKIWKKTVESGLYLTSYRLVVSINQNSKETAHVGYHIAIAKRGTCRDCFLKQGRAVIESASRHEY